MWIRTLSESEIQKPKKKNSLDDPHRTITCGVNVDTMEGVRLSFSSNEDIRNYLSPLHEEEDRLSKLS
jgi:hypothetical protein